MPFLEELVYPLRRVTQRWRAMPNAIIIGAQKGGTTFLFDLLARHPEVGVSFRKEVHFFDSRLDRGLGYYRSCFPLRSPHQPVVLEASPYYLMHPQCSERIARVLPRVRLIALLRDPVKRAYSGYQHRRRRGSETRSFAEALAAEECWMAEEFPNQPVSAFDPKQNFYRQKCYRARGLYAEQLERYFAHFPRDQVLVLSSERLFRAPGETLATVCRYLGINVAPPAFTEASNSGGSYDPIDPRVERDLREFYAPHNRRLYELIGEDFGWDQPEPAAARPARDQSAATT